MSKILLAAGLLAGLAWASLHAVYHGHQRDGWIKAQTERQIDNDGVEVSVTDHWVTLDGMVESDHWKNQYGNLTRQVPGVYGVTNNLRVLNEPAIRALQAMWPFSYEAFPDGLVVLRGTVPDELTRQKLEDMVSRIHGVRRVDNLLQIQATLPTKSPEQQIRDILRLHKIYFDFDKATLKPESSVALDAIGAVLGAYPEAIVRIEGHTDAIGTDAYNQDLSQRRSAAVRQALLQRGIPAARMAAQGFGESTPVADNATATGRAENRRIEFYVVNPGATGQTIGGLR